MLKSVLKEIFIILLLSIAILLILGILFYDYIPINRVVPEKQAYVKPEIVDNEVKQNIEGTEKINITYEVTDADLNIYKQTGSYTEGKANPFLMEDTTTVNDTKDGNSVKNTSDNKNQDTVDKNSTGTFFNEEGIK